MLGAARHLRQVYQRAFCVLIFLVLTTGSAKQDIIDKVVATVNSPQGVIIFDHFEITTEILISVQTHK